MPVRNRFTIYDVMEQRGVFELNPANAGARSADGTALFQGPVQYPKMLYHPEGAEQIIVPAEIIVTPMGPKAVGEQRELIWRVVKNAEEEAELRAEGWHTHPSGSLRAAGKDAPPTGADQRIAELEQQLENLQKERAQLLGVKGPALAPALSGTGTTAVMGPKAPAPAAVHPMSKPL